MAATYTKQRSASHPNRLISALFDASYPAGGYPILPSDVGLERMIDLILFGPALAAAGLLIPAYDPTTGKIRLFYPTGGATAAPAAVAAPLVTSGASTASAVNATTPAITPGTGKEILATTDVSTYTAFGVAFGV